MFLIRLFRFLSGYVVFCGKGGFPERFINLCSMNGISLWDAKSSAGVLKAKTTINGYKKIRTCAKKSGMNIRITEKCGLPFIIAPYTARKGIFAGLLISAVLITLLSSTLWTTEVIGNEKFTREQVIEIAEHYGVRTGVFRHRLNLKDIRTAVRAEVEGISWFSVVIDGSHILLHISETEGTTEIIDNSKPCNIISGLDGEVLKIKAQQGVPAVLPGNAVTKGDLLISGVNEKEDGTPFYSHARGIAVIRTKYSNEITLPQIIVTENISNIRKRLTVSFFGLNIPLSAKPENECIRQNKQYITYDDTILPVGTITESYAQYTQTKKSLTQAQSSLMISFLSFLNEKDIMTDAETESKSVTITRNETSCQIITEHILHKKTGFENYFEVS